MILRYLKLMIFRLLLNFLTLVLIVRISNFMMVKITKSLKVILKMLNLETRQISKQSVGLVCT